MIDKVATTIWLGHRKHDSREKQNLFQEALGGSRVVLSSVCLTAENEGLTQLLSITAIPVRTGSGKNKPPIPLCFHLEGYREKSY